MTKPSVLCHKKRVFQVTILVSVKIRIYGVLLLIHFELKYIYCSKQLADCFSTPVFLEGRGGKDWHYPVTSSLTLHLMHRGGVRILLGEEDTVQLVCAQNLSASQCASEIEPGQPRVSSPPFFSNCYLAHLKPQHSHGPFFWKILIFLKYF